MRFDAVCRAVFVRDFLLKFDMFSAAQFSSKISLVDVGFCWTIMRFPYRDLCFVAVMKCHEISSWGFMLLGGYAISLWLCVAFCWIIVRWDLMFCVCRNANSCWDFLLFRRLWDILMRSSHGVCDRIFVTRGDLRKRCLGFLPLWDVLEQFVAFCCIVFWWDILMRRHSFCPLWVVVIRWYAFCCTLFVRDIVMRCNAFWGRNELFLWDFTMLVCPLCDILMRWHAFWLPNILFGGVM